MERNNLMAKCYPRIKDYCREKHGLEFQVTLKYNVIFLANYFKLKRQETKLNLYSKSKNHNRSGFILKNPKHLELACQKAQHDNANLPFTYIMCP